MQAAPRWAVLALIGLFVVLGVRAVAAGALQGAGQDPPPAAPARVPPFPAQMRPPDDPAIVARGKLVYEISCRACHGPDLRGGDMGGPNLLRSDVMLNDRMGELLAPILAGSRQGRGMPAIPLPPGDVTAVAAHVHSVLAMGAVQGGPPPAPAQPLDIVVGDAAAGQAYFAAKCESCHSPSGDLQGIAARVPDPVSLQNLWVGGGIADRRVATDGAPRRWDVTVTITPASGTKVEGRLDRIDDFTVTLILADGMRRTFKRRGEIPLVDVHDPLAGHLSLLESYTDRDIHNVTAYLVTLK